MRKNNEDAKTALLSSVDGEDDLRPLSPLAAPATSTPNLSGFWGCIYRAFSHCRKNKPALEFDEEAQVSYEPNASKP